MKITTIIIIACTAFIIALFLIRTKGQVKTVETNSIDNENNAEEFVKQLDQLGYFKYVDYSDIESLKNTFIKEFDPEAELISIWNDNTHLPKDFRYYFCDGEEVYEQGGIIKLLNDLELVFKKMDFKCDITKHFEEWDEKNNWLNHTITLNGTEYVIFKNFKGYGWGEASFRIAEILNIELQKQNIDEQIYLVNAGNDGRLALLTKEQYHLIYSTYKDKKWKPLEINEWAKEFGVESLTIN